MNVADILARLEIEPVNSGANLWIAPNDAVTALESREVSSVWKIATVEAASGFVWMRL